MPSRLRLEILVLSCLLVPTVAAAQQPKPTRTVVYKQAAVAKGAKEAGPVELKLHIFEPAGHTKDAQRPAIVFFFGGGWRSGSPSQFYPHCAHLAARGMVAMAADYRVSSRHGTTPFDCVADGKSALRYIRAHAKDLGIDPQRIAAGGGSAGGHVAAAVATVPGLDEPGEDTKVSAVPGALVLFNPVFDNGPEGYGYDRVGERYREISPMHNIRPGIPATIVFLGTEDKLIPVATAKAFQKKVQEAGSRSELKLYEGAAHGFFNYSRRQYYDQTVKAMDAFLESLGYLEADSRQ